MTDSKPIGLYIHIPWCIKKCPYCDFNSHEAAKGLDKNGSSLPEKEYLNALLRDLQNEVSWLERCPRVSSVFIGGGTPSLLSGSFYAELMAGLKQWVTLEPGAEMTIEANPGAIDEANFKSFLDAGINRLSLGAQSFSDNALKQLGRIHGAANIHNAFTKARESGFNNINIDLMHGLPGQGLEDGLNDLNIAFTLAPEHISWYQLTIEKNTAFYKQRPQLPNEEDLYEIFSRGKLMLANTGYQQYEVSAFTQSGYQSRHNTNYWQFGDYIGIGAGAHGKLRSGEGVIYRRWKTRMPNDYMTATEQLAGSQIIGIDDLPLEFLMNALRLTGGFSVSLFEQRTELDFSCIEKTTKSLQEKGLLVFDGDSVRTTEKGYLFLNDVVAAFTD